MRPTRLLLALFFTLTFTSIFSQSVGLVLSGGGAKGLAHVGVLKALEENEVPIDYIVGSSMGAVIGGFYAAGYSPIEIEKIVLSDEFQQWVRGFIDSKYIFHYSTKDQSASILSLNLSLDSTRNTHLSTALAPDHTINFALTEYLAQASQNANYDFDSLMIPFRAIASEIFTQEEMILRRGSLGQSLRASMAVPFFFRPIKVDGKFMFDGGVYNNFPVDVAQKEFNPDVIIGVNVSSKVFNEYPEENDEELLSQSLLFMFLDKSDPTIVGENGVYIEPNLSKYTAFDFPKVQGILDSGYVSSIRKIKEIKSKIGRIDPCESLSEKRNDFLKETKPLIFGGMEFNGFTANQKNYLKALFKTKDKTLNVNEIKHSYYKLISDEYFREVFPSISYDENHNYYKFLISGKPRSNVNGELGGNISSRSISEIYLGLNYTHFNNFLTRHSASFYTGRFYQSMSLKSRVHLRSSKPVYIEPEFMFNQWDFLNVGDIVFNDRSSPVLNQIDRKFGINIGFAAGNSGKLVIQNALINNIDNFNNTDRLVSTDTLDKLQIKGSRHGFEYSRNSLNRKQYASEGEAVTFSANYFSLKEDYEPGSTSQITGEIKERHKWFRLSLEAEKYFKLNNYKIGYYINATYSNQLFLSNYRATIINAPTYYPIQDSRTLFQENLRAFSFIALGLRNVFQLKRNLDFRLETYFFKPLVGVDEENNLLKSKELFISGTSGIVFHSPAGPVSFSVNYYDDPKQKQRLGALLHIGYLLFNKRSIE